jgi:hypothetical protein
LSVKSFVRIFRDKRESTDFYLYIIAGVHYVYTDDISGRNGIGHRFSRQHYNGFQNETDYEDSLIRFILKSVVVLAQTRNNYTVDDEITTRTTQKNR